MLKLRRSKTALAKEATVGQFAARLFLAALITVGLSSTAYATRTLTDDELRAAAPSAMSLSDVPDMSHLDKYIKDKDWAIVLGKALFWDTQVGGGGVQACASCHFQAGADPRSKNQLSPGINAGDLTFQDKNSGPVGPNYQLLASDFPFHEKSPDGKHDNDVVSSQGVPLRTYNGQTSSSDPAGSCDSEWDVTFNHSGFNTRRVEPRNTPSVVNAVFNHRNFWDGRANNYFNGVNPLGLRGQLLDVNGPLPDINDEYDSTNRDPAAAVWEFSCSFSMFGFCFFGSTQPVWPLEQNSSLASQAVGPPGSVFEMSCADRTFEELGRHMRYRRALAIQNVHINDSVFGVSGPKGNLVDGSGKGLIFSYDALIRMAFHDKWWSKLIGNVPGSNYIQMEENFSLFFGLAVQAYEATLVSNQTPFDAFANGDNTAMTEAQKAGLEAFLSGDAKCMACHDGPAFTGADVATRALPTPSGEPTERMVMGDGGVAIYDGGFYNIGVRATNEDLGVGGETAGVPISFSRQASSGLKIDPESMVDPVGESTTSPGPVIQGERVAVDGAFKTPGLRMIALTAPYFHSGQIGTLRGAVQAYKDQFKTLFSEENLDDLDPDILSTPLSPVGGIDITDEQADLITTFMAEALTDQRVVDESAPFDHPSLCVPDGHDEPMWSKAEWPLEAADTMNCLDIPAVGADGRSADGLDPIMLFLDIDQSVF